MLPGKLFADQIRWVTIPAGTFTMGSDPRDAAPPFSNEYPQQRLRLPEFRISRVPITNSQYHQFVAATSHPVPGHWPSGYPLAGSENFPVAYVSWHDAQAFCTWAGGRLPTEAEWEKAARGAATSPTTTPTKTPTETRWWPWGNTLPDSNHAHFNGHAQGVAPAAQSVIAVGQLPLGASPYGVLDMAGNVWEWTNSLYRSYPYQADDGRESLTANGPRNGSRVVRGGSYNHDLRQIRCAARDGMAAGVRDVYIGFRVASSTNPKTNSTLETIPQLALDWVTIPDGEFWMGSKPTRRHAAVLPSEMPQHQLDLAEFLIAQTPVTNAEYAEFVQATGHPTPAHWYDGNIPLNKKLHPVTHVDWYDAQAFCTWAGVRLPTEAEWEKAACGTPTASGTRIYPWGNRRPSANRLNYSRGWAVTTPVDDHPLGASPYGVFDMAGNVWEWVSSVYAPYPYSAHDGREDPQSSKQRVLRGGSFASPDARFVRCAMRSLSYPTRRREHIGFRVAR